MYQTQNDAPMPTQGPQDQAPQEQTPLDGIISQVESYVKDPKMITPQTMTDLLSQLQDLKSGVDTEETSETDVTDSPVMQSMKSRMGGQ